MCQDSDLDQGSTSSRAGRALQSSPELAALRKIVRDFHWMARRYADMRSSYAPGMFNEHVRTLQSFDFDFHLNAPLFARDGMGRQFDKLTEEEVAAAERNMPKGLRYEPDEAVARMGEALEIANNRIFELEAMIKASTQGQIEEERSDDTVVSSADQSA